ncbi:MAG: hypothetical protein QM757_10490, partial [Paludibaculum sp.]
LFFLEDALSPEDIVWFRQIRQQCSTPLAMGELFNSPHEWTPLSSRNGYSISFASTSRRRAVSPHAAKLRPWAK